MSVNTESFHEVLKHPIRRKIVLALSTNGSLSYMDLMGAAESTNTGKFNYHLKVLADLIEKDSKGKYQLTEKGHLATQFLQTFKKTNLQPTSLRMADALLIGFVGFIVTLANPGFWAFLAAAATGIKEIPVFMALSWVTFLFGLIVPGALIWKLSVRRCHSHDAYDIYKAPLVTLAILVPLFAIMIFFNIRIGTGATIEVAKETGLNWSHTQTIVIPMTLGQVVMYGFACSFIGVALSELAFRVRRKITGR